MGRDGQTLNNQRADMQKQLVMTAERYVGRMEVGNNRGDWVDSLNQKAGAPLGSPWCASFVCGCVGEVKSRFTVTSPLKFCASVRALWNGNEDLQRRFPEPGMIVCWAFKGTPNGHCGIVVDVDPKGEWFETIEGNTDNKETIEREGGEVCRNRRPMKLDPEGHMYLLGFLKVF